MTETTAKKGHHLLEGDNQKRVVSFSRKNRIKPSVAAPSDTNLSDATGDDKIVREEER